MLRGSVRRGRILLSLVFSLGMIGMMAAPASAHDELVSSTPAADEVLDAGPRDVRLEFSGSGLTTGTNVSNEIRVLGEDGTDHAGDTSVEGAVLSADIPEPLAEGDYEIQYRVVYADGHAEEDSIPFSVAGAAAESAGPADEGGLSAEDPADVPDAAEEVQDPENRSEPTSFLLPVLFAIGGAGVVVLAAVLVRQKIRQSDSWKQSDEGSAGDHGPDEGDRPGSGPSAS